VCGQSTADCHLDTITIAETEATMSKYRSKERVYATGPNGVTFLKYAVGSPIPEDEARRQGQLGTGVAVQEEAVEVETASVQQDDVEDKAVRPGASMPVKRSRGRGPRASTK
jgi:hypothetical protein